MKNLKLNIIYLLSADHLFKQIDYIRLSSEVESEYISSDLNSLIYERRREGNNQKHILKQPLMSVYENNMQLR